MRSYGTVPGSTSHIGDDAGTSEPPITVIVVDDEHRMVELVASYLSDQGMNVVPCHDGAAALVAARTVGADVMILDLMLPGIDGMEVCRRLRAEGNAIPIMMVTARGVVAERVAGLEAGADDYLVKPFALEELHARVNVLRRRGPGFEDPDRLTFGDLVYQVTAQRLWVDGDEVPLSRREHALIGSLLRGFGQVVSRERLFADVWDDEDIRSNALDVHMSRLRGRLAGSRVRIHALRGVGFRLEVGDS